MIDAASKHNEGDSLAELYGIMRAEPANYAPGEVARHLHHAEHAARRVGPRNKVALVVLAGVVAKGGAEFATCMVDHRDRAADRSAIYVDVERRHKHRDAMAARLGCAGKIYVGNISDFAVGAANHDVFGTWRVAFGIAKKKRNRDCEYYQDRADRL